MNENENQLLTAALWLTPTIGEFLLYLFGAIALLLMSNLSLVERFLYFPQNITLREIVLAPLTIWLASIIGERPASLVSVALFWALIGMFVYIIIWVFMNFSSEFSQDIKVTHYSYPQGADRAAEFRQFVVRNIFRSAAFVGAVVYIIIFSSAFMPVWTTYFRGVVVNGLSSDYLLPAIFSFITVIMALHIFTIFARLILLRRRIFD